MKKTNTKAMYPLGVVIEPPPSLAISRSMLAETSAEEMPPKTNPTVSASHSSSTPAAIAPSAARYAVRRVSAPASTSSMRPVSSSPRSARTAAKMPKTAAAIASVPPTRQAL